MADEMTEHALHAQAASSTEKSTAAHAAAGAPLVPEQRSQFPDQRDEGQQSHGVPPPQIRETTTFQAATIEADHPAGFIPPLNDEIAAEHAVSADSMLAANDAAAVVVHQGPDQLISSSEQEGSPEHEAVQPVDDDDDEEEERHNGVASTLSVFVAQFGALILRIAELDGYDDRESREVVVHALEEGLLPGFPRPLALSEYSNDEFATTAALEAQDDEHEDEEGADDDDQQVVQEEESARRLIEAARDHLLLHGHADDAQQMVQLALMVTRRVRFSQLAELFRNGGFAGVQSYRNDGDFGAVPASAAAVAALEKRTFHVGGDHGLGGCAICLDEEYEDGQELSVMPCSHAFHTECITAWLGQSNMCPLCRHALPTSESAD